MISQYDVISNQKFPHKKMLSLTKKHLQSLYQHPISLTQHHIFDEIIATIPSNKGNKLILDSGCGTGMSTMILAEKYPDYFVIGLDKSQNRISRNIDFNDHAHYKINDNAILARANLIDFWFLSHKNNLKFSKHTLFYPNPWPKSKHLMRRFHAHPIFPAMIQCTESLEVRSNWLIYLEEMKIALSGLGQTAVISELAPNNEPVSLFEQKYFTDKQKIFVLKCRKMYQETI